MKTRASIAIAIALIAFGALAAGAWWHMNDRSDNAPEGEQAVRQNAITLPETSEPSMPIPLREYRPGIAPELDSIFASYQERFPEEATPPIVVMARFDLNLDGVREVFVGYASPQSCDERGCELALFAETDGKWTRREQWMVPAESAYILPFATEGWNGLAFGPGSAGYGVWRMNAEGRYVLAGVAPSIPEPAR